MFRNFVMSKQRFLLLFCASIVFVHLMIFEIPSFYDIYGDSSMSMIADVDALEAVLSNTASSFEYDIPRHLNYSFDSFSYNSTSFLEDVEVDLNDMRLCNKTPPNLVGPIRVFLDEPDMKTMTNMFTDTQSGGHGKPQECKSRHKVAIIVPYRDREAQLKIFLHNLHTLLPKQQLDYAIFIVEQVANQTFNRGKLMNVGYDVASKLYPWQCYIFHDVDLLPEDDRNLYACPNQPRHMSVAIDKFNYELPYSTIFGGISALTYEQVKKINGFSNDFWGWGGEDDDLATRTSIAGYKVSRYPPQIARYKMIKHTQEATNPVNRCRYKIMSRTKRRWAIDGLSTLKYKLVNLSLEPLYTRIQVDLLEKQSKRELRRLFPGC